MFIDYTENATRALLKLFGIGQKTPELDKKLAKGTTGKLQELFPIKPPKGKKLADGLSYVPYDNYPAILHRGEAVLTAKENKNGQGAGGITNNYYVEYHGQGGRQGAGDFMSELQRLTLNSKLIGAV
jgi:hypothetical protein